MPRLPMLDGWRGISIVAVLLCHMVPLGTSSLQLNQAAGVFGMAIFFSLSGFLITSTLYFHPSVRTFAIRRLCRIVPAAWLCILVVFPFVHVSAKVWQANLFFYANLPPYYLVDITSHYWSLCIEIQFYLVIGLVFLALRRRGFALLPLLCLLVTFHRIRTGTEFSSITLYRVDEILSGATLAWLFHGPLSHRLKTVLTKINPAIPLILLTLSSHPAFPRLNYARPYFAATLVGTTLFLTGTRWNRVLESRPLHYLAEISYGLYIWHHITVFGWFASGSKIVKYTKRPVAFAASFALAHVSTFYFERFFIDLGKRLTRQPGSAAHQHSAPRHPEHLPASPL